MKSPQQVARELYPTPKTRSMSNLKPILAAREAYVKGFYDCYEFYNNTSTETFAVDNIDAKTAVLNAVMQVTNIPLEKLKDSTRNRSVVYARHSVHYHLKKRTSYTLQEIGKTFDKDHTTVIHSIKVYKNLLQYDKDFREFDEKLTGVINNQLNQ